MKIFKKRSSIDLSSPEIPFHPCIHPAANRTLARIHLPVAKNCNLVCRYCARQHTNSRSNLPGTCHRIMLPEEALNHLSEQRRIWGNDAVVGISGPGEPLANPETFETLRLVRRTFPSHPLCLCTNGFLLRDKVDELSQMGIRVISMTINGADPRIVKILQPSVKLGKILLMGETAAINLIRAQIEGLKMAVAAGMFVKVNTVLVEGINDGRLIELARLIADAGAGIMNIMPVASPYAESPLQPPNRTKLENLRTECEKFLPQFKLCRRCRADAAGIPGQINGRCCS